MAIVDILCSKGRFVEHHTSKLGSLSVGVDERLCLCGLEVICSTFRVDSCASTWCSQKSNIQLGVFAGTSDAGPLVVVEPSAACSAPLGVVELDEEGVELDGGNSATEAGIWVNTLRGTRDEIVLALQPFGCKELTESVDGRDVSCTSIGWCLLNIKIKSINIDMSTVCSPLASIQRTWSTRLDVFRVRIIRSIRVPQEVCQCYSLSLPGELVRR